MQTLPFAELWEKHAPQTLEEATAFWEERADAFNAVTRAKDKTERHALVAWLEERGAVGRDFSVLDLGCGAGRYALELGRRVGRLTGIDIAPGMIAHARRNAKAAGLENAEFLVLPWQKADLDALGWRGSFDLVFASMSPAVHSEETLLKMHAASRRFCFLSGFIRRSDTLLREIVRRIAPGADFPPREGSVIYAFNVLWQHGIYADVACRDNNWTDEWDLPAAMAAYAGEIGRLLPELDDPEGALERELRALESGGRIVRRMVSKVAWLFWEV